MPFDLEITIAGMCLLVRDSDTNPRMLHVLLPPTEHQHEACLLYRKKHTDPRAGATVKEEINLTGKQLDLSALTSRNKLNLKFPPAVFDFESLGGRSVKRTLLDGASLPPELRFRMKLAAGDTVDHRPGGLWKLGPKGTPRRMATAIKWRLADVPRDKLVLDIGDGAPRVLTPLDEGKGLTIRLFLLHVPGDEIPTTIPMELPRPNKPTPQPDQPALHFLSYYPILNPPEEGPTPLFDSDGGEGRYPTISRSFFFGSELTCMVATAPTKP